MESAGKCGVVRRACKRVKHILLLKLGGSFAGGTALNWDSSFSVGGLLKGVFAISMHASEVLNELELNCRKNQACIPDSALVELPLDGGVLRSSISCLIARVSTFKDLCSMRVLELVCGVCGADVCC